MQCSTAVGSVLRYNLLPIIKFTIDRYRYRRTRFIRRGHAFETADIRHHLVIIIVAVPALHGFNIPAVFLIELIGKSVMLLLPFLVTTGHPFVPSGDRKRKRLNSSN